MPVVAEVVSILQWMTLSLLCNALSTRLEDLQDARIDLQDARIDIKIRLSTYFKQGKPGPPKRRKTKVKKEAETSRKEYTT